MLAIYPNLRKKKGKKEKKRNKKNQTKRGKRGNFWDKLTMRERKGARKREREERGKERNSTFFLRSTEIESSVFFDLCVSTKILEFC